MKGRRIVLGISGGIAAYKASELVRLLVKQGAEVQVVLTPAAEHFVTRLTLQTLSTRPVLVDLFDLDEESRIGHIQVADRADLFVVAPATADVIARLAAGMANDLLTTIALATTAPLLLAPAMNVNMWRHAQTQDNVARLVARGATVVGPDSGDLACGWVGAGRLVEPAEIVAACERVLARGKPATSPSPSPTTLTSTSTTTLTSTNARVGDLAGHTIVVTAGPTEEAIDPVRFIGNRSSGKMGFALARRAAARGARVLLVAGPVSLTTPEGVTRIDVTSASQMRDAVLEREPEASCVIKAAAVADYRPVAAADRKIKKGEAATITLTLEKNPDILAELVERRRARGGRRPYLVGFAAETGDLEAQATAKLASKGCDLLVANDVSERDSTFGADTNRVLLLAPNMPVEPLPLLSKEEVANRILDRVAQNLSVTPNRT